MTWQRGSIATSYASHITKTNGKHFFLQRSPDAPSLASAMAWSFRRSLDKWKRKFCFASLWSGAASFTISREMAGGGEAIKDSSEAFFAEMFVLVLAFGFLGAMVPLLT